MNLGTDFFYLLPLAFFFFRVVRPGGLLILELSHPGELFGGSFLDPLDFVDCWEVAENGEAEFAEKRSSNFSEAESDEDDEEEGGEEGTSKKSRSAVEEEEDEEDDEDFEDEEDSPSPGSKGEDKLKRVLVEYGREGDDFDPATQILSRTVGLSLFDPNGDMVSSDVSVVPQRQFSLQEIDLLARATGGAWRIVAVHGDLNEEVPLDGEDSYRMVVVLKRT